MVMSYSTLESCREEGKRYYQGEGFTSAPRPLSAITITVKLHLRLDLLR